MATPAALQVPYRDKPADETGLLSQPWQQFFRALKALIDPLGQERDFELVNNQGT
jgi:hypothetical protein